MKKTRRRKCEPLQPRFERNFIPVTESGCWLWTGYSRRDGYGYIAHNKRAIGAHRASWIIYRGDIPEGLHVCHTCDVRDCVNPDHLFLGTASDNMQDCVRKGRSAILLNCRGGIARAAEIKRAQTHCKRGHQLFGENVRVSSSGGTRRRNCKACLRMYHALRNAKRRAACRKPE